MDKDFSGMTVNERLAVAGLTSAYDEAQASGELSRVNTVLRKVGLRQDESGMNWSLDDD